MADVIYTVKVRGDAGSFLSMMGQVGRQVRALDARLRAMTSASYSPKFKPPQNIEELAASGGTAKDIQKWTGLEELGALRTRFEAAQRKVEELLSQKKVDKKVLAKAEEEAFNAAADYTRRAIQLAKQLAGEQEAAEKKAAKAAEDAAARKVRAAEREAAERRKLADQLTLIEARGKQKIGLEQERQRGRIALENLRQANRAATEERRMREREARRAREAEAREAKRAADEKIRQAKRASQEMQKQVRNTTQLVKSAFTNVFASGMSFMNGLRMISQGFTELGRVLTSLIAVPLAGFFFLAGKTAVDFESAMTRVSKTTGIEGEALEELRQGIRDFSKVTRSSHTELATFAEQLGQVGVNQVKPMMTMIRTVEMMATATDIAADEITKSMGRIGTAFGYDLNTAKGAKNIYKLANVINKLENTTAASAGEIIDGLLNVASVGGMLDIPVQDMAAVVAMMESMGVAADAVGNRVTRVYQQLITKSDKAAKFMEGFTATIVRDGEEIKRVYSGDPGEFLAWLNEDKTQVLTDFMTALSQVSDEDQLMAMADWFELVGQVGGKVGVLAGNVQGLGEALKNAREEFEKGKSLFEEYDKALLTTESHLFILKNNLDDAAITMGDAFLPVINRVIEYAIPIIQILTDAFKSLSWETKLLVVGIPLLAAVFAPLLFIVSQTTHAFSFVGMGIHTLFTGLRSVGTGIFSVIKAGGGLLKLFGLLVTGGTGLAGFLSGGLVPVLLKLALTFGSVIAAGGALLLLGKLIVDKLRESGVDIEGFLRNLAGNMRRWGENIMVTFGEGLVSGAINFVFKAIAAIAEVIAGFFESHSPPKMGPLSDIDKWGGPLFTTFLRGFYLADFSILEDVGSIIQSILSNMFSGDDAEARVRRMFLSARTALAELIDIFNKTGEVSASVLARVVDGTGALGSEVSKLITLWLNYERVQRRIKDLEKERQSVTKGYEEEVERISKSNLSAEEKAEKIREVLNKRNRELDRIEAETEAEKEKSDVLKEQLDWQKAFIKAQIDQASAFQKLEKALGSLGDTLRAFSFGGGKDADEEGEEDDDTLGLKAQIEKRLKSAKQVIQEFFRGIRGEASTLWMEIQDGTIDPELAAELQKAYEWGSKLHGLFDPDKPLITIGKPSEELSDVEKILQGLLVLGKEFTTGLEEGFQVFLGPLLYMWTEIKDAITDVIIILGGEVGKAAVENGGVLVTIFRWLGRALGFVASGVANIMTLLVTGPFAGVIELLAIDKRMRDEGTSVFDAIKEGASGLWDSIFNKNAAQESGQRVGVQFGAAFANGLYGSAINPEYAQGIASFYSGSVAPIDFGNIFPPITGVGDAVLMGTAWGEAIAQQEAGLNGLRLVTVENFARIKGDASKEMSTLYDDGMKAPLEDTTEKMVKWHEDLAQNSRAGWQAFKEQQADAVSGYWDESVKPSVDEVATGLEQLFGGDMIRASTTAWEAVKNSVTPVLANWWGETINPLFRQVGVGMNAWFTLNIPKAAARWGEMRDTFKAAFDVLPGMVATVFTSLSFKPEVLEAIKVSNDLFEQTGRGFALAISLGLSGVAGEVVSTMAGIVDQLIAEVERALASLDTLAVKINEINNMPVGGFGGVSFSPVGGAVSATAMASGGIAVRPTLAMIADGGEPEAVIPLSKLTKYMNDSVQAPEGDPHVIIEINNPQFKDENDMRKLSRIVKRDMDKAVRDKQRMRGRR